MAASGHKAVGCPKLVQDPGAIPEPLLTPPILPDPTVAGETLKSRKLAVLSKEWLVGQPCLQSPLLIQPKPHPCLDKTFS